MNWKLKSTIQNLISLLPSSLSYSAYYYMQRNFGTLKKVNPIKLLKAGIETCRQIEKVGRSPIGSTFLEVGTGRRINTPLAFWLLGAEKVITVDLNPYLKEELVQEDIDYIRRNKTEIEQSFNGHIFNNRLKHFLEFTNSQYTIVELLKFCNIQYIAPGDASKLPLSSNSIDFHTSYTVFEHIPLDILKKILLEGNRIIKKEGMFVHKIDYSDHFSHSDKSISSINFLQFTDSEWEKIAGNRYMYMNRLRHDDFINLFSVVNHSILLNEPDVNQKLLDLIKNKDGSSTLSMLKIHLEKVNIKIK